MPDNTGVRTDKKTMRIRHRGRESQVPIYLGKLFRMFVYQNDWKVLPMAAVIAGLVAMVIRNIFFRTMEGTLMSAFALTCVAVWNGCFNSIQVICRERDVVKRDHRSGMHISSYVAAHLIYQAVLCLLQTAITVYVCLLVGVQFPENGLFTPWMTVDMGITLFLITFASDALALWVSSLAHTTTAAMTIMPFVLIFQLVFSGGMLTLPEWCGPLSDLTISKYGLTAVAAQADYNNRPPVIAWNSVVRMWNTKVGGTVTVDQILDFLSKDEIPAVHNLREETVRKSFTPRQIAGMIRESGEEGAQAFAMLMDALPEEAADKPFDLSFTVGDTVDYMAKEPVFQSEREKEVNMSMTVGEIVDALGRDKTREQIRQKTMEASYNAVYEYSRVNVAGCWASLVLITLVNAALTTITLEFIDRDKR